MLQERQLDIEVATEHKSWEDRRQKLTVRMRAGRRAAGLAAFLAIVGGFLAFSVSGAPAEAHSVSNDYNSGYCYGEYWSEHTSGNIEVGMNDDPMSSSLGECQASQVLARIKDLDGTWTTESDYDGLVPLGVEVAMPVLHFSYSKHQSKEDDGTWWSITVNH